VQHIAPLVRKLARDKSLDLFASKQKQKRVDSIELVREAREQQRQELAYNSRPFVLCGLPIRRPPPGTLRHVRRNGRFRLEVLGHPDYGLPFGQDRLIPLWIAALAVRQKSRMVLFRSAAEILEELDLPKDGPHYRRLVEGFQRIFTSTIYFGTDNSGDGRREVWDCHRFHFFDRLRIWCSRSADEAEDQSRPAPNIVNLSESFWQEIQAHPIPVDVRVVRELTNISGCLDLYMWLCWRCRQARRTENVPLFGDFGLASQLGVTEYSRDRNFRKRLREWLRLVKLYWPDCPVRFSDNGSALVVSSGQGIFDASARRTDSAATEPTRG
jgi:replication initiator protein